MKKQVMRETTFCDVCGKQTEYVYRCNECGTEMCYSCRGANGKEYVHSVLCSGSGDGFYCNACDVKLTKSGTDKKHAAYRAVASLRMAGRLPQT